MTDKEILRLYKNNINKMDAFEFAALMNQHNIDVDDLGRVLQKDTYWFLCKMVLLCLLVLGVAIASLFIF